MLEDGRDGVNAGGASALVPGALPFTAWGGGAYDRSIAGFEEQ
jgi:hypothetical protein